MKRKALIIGNSGNKNDSEEYLEGVEKDINNYNNFLQSNIGGAWNSDEITLSIDETKEELLQKILETKQESNDFVFVLFSGHGSYSLREECRKLYVYDENSTSSDNYDFLYEYELTNIADKQITIIDTCANNEDDDLLKESTLMDGLSASYESYKDNYIYRYRYENAIESCQDQQVVLYSSSIDESSNDDSELGGLFAYNLLKIATRNKQEVLSAKEAYSDAKKQVQTKTKGKQNPQCRCIKSITLPFSIKE